MSKLERDRRHDAKRREEKPWRAWYNTAWWQATRKQQLQRQPLCERHLKRGDVVLANTVNHTIPHRGNLEVFRAGPFESVCAECHSSEVQGEEVRGFAIGCDEDGSPNDPAHHWNS